MDFSRGICAQPRASPHQSGRHGKLRQQTGSHRHVLFNQMLFFFGCCCCLKKQKTKTRTKTPKQVQHLKKQEIPHKNQTCNSLENKTIGCCIPGLRQLSGGHLSQGSEPKIPKVAGLNSLLIP